MSRWDHGLTMWKDSSNNSWQTKVKMTSNNERSYSAFVEAKHMASFKIPCNPVSVSDWPSGKVKTTLEELETIGDHERFSKKHHLTHH